MKIRRTKENILINDYKNNSEEVANRYVIRCATSAIIIAFIVWLLTMLNIFLVDRTMTSICFFSSLAVYVLGGLVCFFGDLSHKRMKYYILLWLVVIITIMTATMTFHAILACLLPIVCSAMYCSKKVIIYTYALMVISIILSVFVGYYYGLCDTNMVLLSGKPMSDYLGTNNEFLLTEVNNNPLETLTIFFVLPRCMIAAGFAMVCNSISKIIMMNHSYAEKMENLAEVDGMTGLYNKSKYLDMINGKYTNIEKVAVIFWDINDLKITNDTIGHEAGDQLISMVATSIRSIIGPKDMAYRIGGDEFVMIIMNCDEKEVREKLIKWEEALNKAANDWEHPISVSRGYAVGEGKNISDIIRRADKMMYENKREWHQKKDAESFSSPVLKVCLKK